MAVLLAWIDHAGRALDPHIWQRLTARAAARSCAPAVEHHGPGWALWAAPSHPREATLGVAACTGDGAFWLLDRAPGVGPAPLAAGPATIDAWLAAGQPCAAIGFDPGARSLCAYRDCMGQRFVCSARLPGAVLIASSESLLLAHPLVDAQALDPLWLAAFVAGVSPPPSATVYAAISGLASGEWRRWDEHGRPHSARQRVTPDRTGLGLTDAALIEQVRGLTAQAVARAVRGYHRPGVSLSGGLDSSVVAVELAAARPGESLGAVTYGFDTWPAIDERALAAATAARLGLSHICVRADDLVPFAPQGSRPVCPDTPLMTHWREVKEACHAALAQSGADAVVSGNFGDHLWAHPARWVNDALAHARWDVLGAGLRRQWQDGGVRALWREPGLRALARPWRLRRPQPSARLAVLAPRWRDALLDLWRTEITALRDWPRPSQALLAFNAYAAFDAYGEDWYAQRHGLAHIQPFRDQALTAFMLALPAQHSNRGPASKWLWRHAYAGALPPAVLARPKASDLSPIAEAALAAPQPRLAEFALAAQAQLAPLVGHHALSHVDHEQWANICLSFWLAQRGPDQRGSGH